MSYVSQVFGRWYRTNLTFNLMMDFRWRIYHSSSCGGRECGTDSYVDASNGRDALSLKTYWWRWRRSQGIAGGWRDHPLVTTTVRPVVPGTFWPGPKRRSGEALVPSADPKRLRRRRHRCHIYAKVISTGGVLRSL